jgi:hypothetical protein
MGVLRNGAQGCRAPVVTGHYEHSSIESITDGLGGQIAMKVRTDYPAGSVRSLIVKTNAWVYKYTPTKVR